MIDFTKRDLYADEKRKLDKFKNNILVKESERDLVDNDSMMGDFGDGYERMETSTIVDSPFDFGDGGFGFGDSEDDDFGFGGFGGFGEDEREGGITEDGDLSNMETHKPSNAIVNFLLAPLYLAFFYIPLHITRNNMKLKNWSNELEMMKKVNIVVVFVAILLLLLGGRSIISPVFQLIAGVVTLIISTVLLNKINNKGDNEEDTEENEEDNFGFGGNFDDDLFGGDSLSHSGEVDLFSDTEIPTFEDSIATLDDGENDFFEDESFEGNSRLPKSPISADSDESFMEGMADVFKANAKYTGKGHIPLSREELLKSFSGYLVGNFDKFGEWKVINETSISYMNLAFTMFLALEKINNKIGRGERQEDGSLKYGKMYVRDIKENTMMYRIEIELPEYFNYRTLNNKKEEFTNVLKKSEDDDEVDFLISTFRQGYVIKLFKPVNTLISVGDILRYEDEASGISALDDFLNEKKGLPVLLGIKNNEYPVVIDYEDNTSGVIVGGSGSGKSWTTFQIMLNFIVANDYHNVNMVIYDKKNAPFWNQYAMLPHVLGYHTEPEDLLDICNEVYAEITRRKELLNQLNAESVKGLRSKYRRNKEYDKLKEMPLLLFIVDEITSTMQEIEGYPDKKETYHAVRGVMSKITQEGRSLGVRMIAIGQRSIDTSIPKNVMANASFKFGMKMDALSDFTPIGMEQSIKDLGVPKGAGRGIAMGMGFDPSFIKTLSVGGVNDDQVLAFLRVIALEWTRRSLGDTFSKETYKVMKKSYNRDKFREKALNVLASGGVIPDEKREDLITDISAEFKDSEKGRRQQQQIEDAKYKEVTEVKKEDSIVKDTDYHLTTDEEFEDEMSFNEGDEDYELGYEDNDNDNIDSRSKESHIEEGYIADDNDDNVEEDDDLETYDIGFSINDNNIESEEYGNEDSFRYNVDLDDDIDMVIDDEDEDLEIDLEELEQEEGSQDNLNNRESVSILESEKLESDGDYSSFDDMELLGSNEEGKEEISEDDDYEFDFDGIGDFDVQMLDDDVLASYDSLIVDELINNMDSIEEINVEDYTGYVNKEELEPLSDINTEDRESKTIKEPEELATSKNTVSEESKNLEGSEQSKEETKAEIKAKDKTRYKEMSEEQRRRTVKAKPKANANIKGKETITRPKARTTSKERPNTNTRKEENTISFTPKTSSNSRASKRVPNMEIRRFILENGEVSLGVAKIRKEVLREHFEGRLIGEALKSNLIVSYDDKYFSTLL